MANLSTAGRISSVLIPFLTLIGIISSKSYSFEALSIILSKEDLSLIKSTLFISKMTFNLRDLKLSARFSSIFESCFVASIIKIATSTSSMLFLTDFTISSESLVLGLCIPGVSIKTYCISPFVSIPFIFVRVV